MDSVVDEDLVLQLRRDVWRDGSVVDLDYEFVLINSLLFNNMIWLVDRDIILTFFLFNHLKLPDILFLIKLDLFPFLFRVLKRRTRLLLRLRRFGRLFYGLKGLYLLQDLL